MMERISEKDAAKTAAFSDAGVTEDEITRLKVSKDHDDGRSIYEVDFTVASTGEEYDYEISAEDGSILQVDKEMDKGKCEYDAESGSERF